MAEDRQSTLNLSELPRFSPEVHLEGGWRVVRYLPGSALALELERGEQVRAALRKGMVLLVPLLIAALFVAGTLSAEGDLGLVTYPVVALCLLVVLLGLLSLPRDIRRIRQGVRLELDAQAGRAAGFPAATSVKRALSDLRARNVEVPLSGVREVRLVVHRAVGRQGLLSHVELELRISRADEELVLQGPHASGADPEWQEARDHLLPLACELARIAQRPVKVDHRFSGEELSITPEQVAAITPGPPLGTP